MIGKKNKADFNFKTVGILKSIICCWMFKERKSLRYKAETRNVLYFLKGRQKLDKEMDVANMILDIRKIKYLMKIMLEKD